MTGRLGLGILQKSLTKGRTYHSPGGGLKKVIHYAAKIRVYGLLGFLCGFYVVFYCFLRVFGWKLSIRRILGNGKILQTSFLRFTGGFHPRSPAFIGTAGCSKRGQNGSILFVVRQTSDLSEI
jgi:hypothetical protein